VDNEPSIDDRLEKLWGHLDNMTPDQIREHVRRIRADRRLSKQRPSVIKSVKATSDTAKTKARKLLAGADADMIERILKRMGNGS